MTGAHSPYINVYEAFAPWNLGGDQDEWSRGETTIHCPNAVPLNTANPIHRDYRGRLWDSKSPPHESSSIQRLLGDLSLQTPTVLIIRSSNLSTTLHYPLNYTEFTDEQNLQDSDFIMDNHAQDCDWTGLLSGMMLTESLMLTEKFWLMNYYIGY